MADQTIATWTPAELRRFVVNNILTDPGALPKEAPADPSTELPGQPLTDGEIPVWDDSSKRWTASNAAPLSYIRVQGNLSGFIADTNFRIYNLSGASVVMEYDPDKRLGLDGTGRLTVTPGNYMLGFYVDGPASGYEAGWTLTYNGAAIDYTISNGINYGGLGVVQNMGCSASGMTNFFASAGGVIQISGFQTAAPVVAGMWAMYLPS